MHTSRRYLSRKMVVEPFHDKKLLKDMWGENWGVSNDIQPVKKVLMHRPGKEILSLHSNAQQIEYGSVLAQNIKGTPPQDEQTTGLPNLESLQFQHDQLAGVLTKEGIEVVYLEGESESWPERTFTRDLGMVIPGGVILPRLALYIRYGETVFASQTFSRLGVPMLGCIQGNGFAEGGSFSMLDSTTAIIGRSERVNPDGIEQVRQILSHQNIDLISVDLPSTIIHLDEAFLLLDQHTALINQALLPFWFLDELHKRKLNLLHVDPRDPALSINVLPIAPGRVVCPSSGIKTNELLRSCGIKVITVDISEFYKLGGGIHCLTLPLTRN
ncbi:dimethylarginine dimethylaminohydrolase family protein [Halobacillus naozhouensis]|uniref:Arginine deiminase family protein n=1 Tax=Halobacillus naozhouensis TaxID=554880 RepID=A0ABY8J036_9BACI|nr:arginine deiminase family protein [Halobacillus naozhouensis]WFT75421.1 arginine deiminase family protein [Halobacillus naozhouensis]